MNEIIFLIQAFFAIALVLVSKRLGKEAIFCLIALYAVLANLFVVKQINILGLEVTASDVFSVSSIFALNILRELFGQEEASKAIKISFVALASFFLMAKFHLLYLPASVDVTHKSFEIILQHNFRIVASSILVFFLTQHVDLFLFNTLKKRLQNRLPVTRMIISVFLSQVFDTTLFSFIGLYGIIASIANVILFSTIVKCLSILISSLMLKTWIRCYGKI